jgi:UDP-2,3-diacylglucosamine pyrophosphatase LpxH
MATPSRQVYIISDLHLGGAYDPPGRGFRLCTHTEALVEFVNRLTEKPCRPKIELIINGDTVDFLAEQNAQGVKWTPFTTDQVGALKKLNDIAVRDSAFFGALKAFLGKGHRLVILLGNHDLELCLPRVREQLEELLGADQRSDYEFIYDGEAYTVGEALIEHGNRYDKFNVVDYDALRRLRALLSRQQPVPEKYAFNPPAGSKMVSDVINPIKESYRFVDLLKPESGAVVPLLLALEPKYKEVITRVVRHAVQAAEHRMEGAALPRFGGDIHANPDDAAGDFGSDISSGGIGAMIPPAPAPLTQLLNDVLGPDAAVFQQRAQLVPSDTSAIGSDISTFDATVGFARLLLGGNPATLEQRLPALFMAMRALKYDRSFDPKVETATEYRDAAEELVGDKFEYVIFGHTHQAKDVDLGGGRRYLNTGTWADVLRFPEDIFGGNAEGARGRLLEFAECMQRGDFSRWTLFRPTYVRLDVDANGHIANAELCDYHAGGNGSL